MPELAARRLCTATIRRWTTAEGRSSRGNVDTKSAQSRPTFVASVPLGGLASPLGDGWTATDTATKDKGELHVHSWGRASQPRVVCLHGVTGHGGHFAPLGRSLTGCEVLAPDLLGHGRSRHAPPWSIDAHVEELLGVAGDRPGTWLGHSFGARLVLELAARAPHLVERVVLLEPALHLPPHVALLAATSALAGRTYASLADAVEGRYEESVLSTAPRELVASELAEHLVQGDDGRFRYRFTRSAIVTAFGELATRPPPFSIADVPTLVVLGRTSYLTYDLHLDDHRAELGDLLQVVVVEGGHTILWDAFDQTAEAIAEFVAARAA